MKPNIGIKNGGKELVPVFLFIAVIAISVTIWSVFFREPDVVLTPDYAPQKTEQNQTPIEDDKSEKMEAAEGGGAVSLTYAAEVSIDLSEETAALMFANPNKSTQDIVIQIVVQEQILAQSGTITSGNQITKLDLLDGAVEKLSAGGYDGKFVILYYNPETSEKAVVNTEIPIHITVSE